MERERGREQFQRVGLPGGGVGLAGLVKGVGAGSQARSSKVGLEDVGSLSAAFVRSWWKPRSRASEPGSEGPRLEAPVPSPQFLFLSSRGPGAGLSPRCPYPSRAPRPGVLQGQQVTTTSLSLLGRLGRPLGKVGRWGPASGPREACPQLLGWFQFCLPCTADLFLKSCRGEILYSEPQ